MSVAGAPRRVIPVLLAMAALTVVAAGLWSIGLRGRASGDVSASAPETTPPAPEGLHVIGSRESAAQASAEPTRHGPEQFRRPALPSVAPSPSAAPVVMRRRPAEPGPTDPKQARDRMEAAVRRSGSPTVPGIVAAVGAVGQSWKDLADRAGIYARLGEWECHAEGCFVTIVQRTPEDVERLSELINASRAFTDWPASKMHSLTIPMDDGTFESTWLLSTPPTAPR